jgi:hypothetical protein
MAARLELFGSSVVALGSFNPVLFSPDWLERNKLIGKEDAEAARKGENFMLTRPFSRMETDWFTMQVTDDNYSVTSNTAALDPRIKDLALGALSLVPHTPVSALGLNFYGHYKMETLEEYHKIGDVLVPKDIWTTVFPGDDRSYGMATLQVQITPAKRNEQPKTGDRTNITVQPSVKVRHGVYFQYNDHHVIQTADDLPDTAVEIAVKLIDENWQRVWDDSVRVFESLIDHAFKA